MIRLAAVVVPATDEEDLVGPCLDALAATRAHLRRHQPAVAVRTVVVLDCCRDRTAAAVAARPDVEVVTISARRVGAARAAGAAHVLASTALPRHEVWLANTDADSQVRPQWLTGMIRAADDGARIVLGTVVPGPGLAPGVAGSWHARHSQRDGHPHVHGANFGIRADTYTALGGWPDTASGEDVGLARRAAAAGTAIVRSAAFPVLTSARAQGRAPAGFAGHLRTLAGEAAG